MQKSGKQKMVLVKPTRSYFHVDISQHRFPYLEFHCMPRLSHAVTMLHIAWLLQQSQQGVLRLFCKVSRVWTDGPSGDKRLEGTGCCVFRLLAAYESLSCCPQLSFVRSSQAVNDAQTHVKECVAAALADLRRSLLGKTYGKCLQGDRMQQ